MENRRNSFEQIRAEITEAVNRERAADCQALEQETEIRRKYEDAREKMAAALDSGDMAGFKAAGMTVEEHRLELEFIEKSKERGKKPGATAETDSRVKTSLRAECERIRADALAQLNTIFDEAASVAADALRQYAAIDNLYASWETGVMHKEKKNICPDNDKLLFAQFQATAKAQLERYKYI